MEIYLFVIIIVALGALVFYVRQNRQPVDASTQKLTEELATVRAESARKSEDLVRIQKDFESEKARAATFEEKGRGIQNQFIEVREKLKSTESELKSTSEKLTKFEAEKTRSEKEVADWIEKLDRGNKAAEDARVRLDREKVEKEEARLAARDRMWAEHESVVLTRLRELCQKPELAFSFYENTNLPDGFDGKFKPDFLIEFLGQFIYFDAKSSRSENLATYLATTAKSTATKLQSQKNIYGSVFFVVPTLALAEIPVSKTYFYEGRFKFFVIGPEGLPAILAAFKEVTKYKNLEKINPEDRENFIKTLAAYDHHIDLRNAFDIQAARAGAHVLDGGATLPTKMRAAIAERKKSIRFENFAPAETKKLLNSRAEQKAAIENLTAPIAEVSAEKIAEADHIVKKLSSK